MKRKSGTGIPTHFERQFHLQPPWNLVSFHQVSRRYAANATQKGIHHQTDAIDDDKRRSWRFSPETKKKQKKRKRKRKRKKNPKTKPKKEIGKRLEARTRDEAEPQSHWSGRGQLRRAALSLSLGLSQYIHQPLRLRQMQRDGLSLSLSLSAGTRAVPWSAVYERVSDEDERGNC